MVLWQVLEELHVVDWALCDKPAAPYRRIEDYLVSVLKPKIKLHGVVSDPEFSQMKSIAKAFLDNRCVVQQHSNSTQSCSMLDGTCTMGL